MRGVILEAPATDKETRSSRNISLHNGNKTELNQELEAASELAPGKIFVMECLLYSWPRAVYRKAVRRLTAKTNLLSNATQQQDANVDPLFENSFLLPSYCLRQACSPPSVQTMIAHLPPESQQPGEESRTKWRNWTSEVQASTEAPQKYLLTAARWRRCYYR